MSSAPLIVRLQQGHAEVCNGPNTYCVTAPQDAHAAYGCPTELIAAALGS